MKAIFKGNNFVIQWSITDALTSLPFDFTGMFVEMVLYSENYKGRVSGVTLTGNKLQAEIPADMLPTGVYNIKCDYRNDVNSGHCLCRRAFQITRNPECSTGDDKVVIESFAAPLKLENMDINYIGHFPTYESLPDRDKPSWALVGNLKEAEPCFFYIHGAVPPGCQAGWNNLKDILGTYDLTIDKVSIFDFSLVTEYNVSHNHTHLAKVFNPQWLAIPYRSWGSLFIQVKKYRKNDVVNMPGYTLYSFRATADMQNIAPYDEKETNAFTFEEALAVTPQDYHIPGIKLTFINRMDGKAYTFFFRGESPELWFDVQSWQVIDYTANDEVYRTNLFDRFHSYEEINGAQVTEQDLKEVDRIIKAIQADKVVSFYYDPDKSSVTHFGTLDCYLNETKSEFGCYISTVDGYFIARCNYRNPSTWAVVSIASGGEGGGTGTGNYNELTNRPSVNGNLLTGNMSSEELGLPAKEDVERLVTNAGPFRTLADMATFTEVDGVSEGAVCFNLEDDRHYIFHAANSLDDETGKWRRYTEDGLTSTDENRPLSASQGRSLKLLLDAKVIQAGGVPFDAKPTKGSTNPVTSDGLYHNTIKSEPVESINLEEEDEFASIYKGDKGDPFKYEDFTAEQLDQLATDVATKKLSDSATLVDASDVEYEDLFTEITE